MFSPEMSLRVLVFPLWLLGFPVFMENRDNEKKVFGNKSEHKNAV